MKLDKIRRFAKKEGYDDILFLGKWKKYDVYEPIFNDKKTVYIGLPYLILVDGDKIRMSTAEEALEHVDDS